MNAHSHKTFAPSLQQSAVLEWTANGTGSTFIEAVAGAGKTTTLIEALKLTKGSVAFAAFNTKIAKEIKDKVEREVKEGRAPADMLQRVRVGTFHSFGFSAWRSVYKAVVVDAKAKRDETEIQLRKNGCPEHLFDVIEQLVSLAKQRALGAIGSVDDEALWWEIIDHYDLNHEIEDESQMMVAIDYARRCLKFHREIAPRLINFDDMIYMPVVTGVRMWGPTKGEVGHDWVLVDEAQDTNPARRAMARKMLKPNGQSMWVGDRRQGIYGFSGADADAIERIIKEFRCSSLPLTTTYRCLKAVVKQAQTIVSHIQAHETAPEGLVRVVQFSDMGKEKFEPTDAILCRNTKPLVEMAYSLIRKGVACHVEGKDIGMGLLKMANKYKAKNIDALIAKLDDYLERETQKLIAKGKETMAESLSDRVGTLKVLAEGCKTIPELTKKIVDLFQDSEERGHKQTLTLSTVHKSKGREWPRVYIVGHSTLMPSKYARQEWQIEQEMNLKYVAYTRAQAELVLVPGHE